jgi:hypothetical protein
MVALASVLIIARSTSGSLPAVSYPIRSDYVTVVRSEVAEITLQVRGNLSSVDAVHAWATRISTVATSAKGESSNQMSLAWDEVIASAAQLSALTEVDGEAANRALIRMNNAADDLAAAALGVQPLVQ